ncbi:MAG: tetratricopeptide repeat protein, partial [Alistipes sp.]|nr:tetratricopeptide repeat protein [Alistipes sp.]
MKRLLFILILILTVVACDSHSKHWDTIKEIDSYISEHPDSALVVLENIDVSELSSKEERAKHALLYSMALDKNYIDKTDFDVLQPAIDYYEDSGTTTDKFQTYYLQGRIYQNQGNDTQAMIAYAQAKELLSGIDAPFLVGQLHTEIGNIYRSNYDYAKSLEAYQTAYDHYMAVGLESYAAYALLDIGLSYWNLEDNAKGIEYINEALQMALKLHDEYLEMVCYQNIVFLCDDIDAVERCGSIVDALVNRYNIEKFGSGSLVAIASYYAEVEEYDRMEVFIGRAWSNATNAKDSINVYLTQADILKHVGKADEALRYFEAGVKLQNREVRSSLKQPIETTQKEYFQQQAEYNAYCLKKDRELYITLGVIALLALIVVAMYIRHRMLSKDLEISKYMMLSSELQSAIRDREDRLSAISEYISSQQETHNTMVGDMHSQIAELFEKQYELLDRLSNTYYETQGVSKEKESIFKQVKSEIDKFATDKRSIAQ